MLNLSRDFLYRCCSGNVVVGESEYEFAEYVCESLVSLGSSNLQCVAGDSSILSLYLQQVREMKICWNVHTRHKLEGYARNLELSIMM